MRIYFQCQKIIFKFFFIFIITEYTNSKLSFNIIKVINELLLTNKQIIVIWFFFGLNNPLLSSTVIFTNLFLNSFMISKKFLSLYLLNNSINQELHIT